MKNSTKDIGKKIKAVRTEKKMTQNELCGTEITRNHLSLIESGKSLPSLGTLCYIAERLEIPVGYFFSEDVESEVKFATLFTIEDAKEAFLSNSFERCIQIGEMIPKTLRGDEMSLLMAKSYLSIALCAAEKLDIPTALQKLRDASDSAQQSCYLSDDFSSAVSYYELLFRSLTQKNIPLRLTDVHEASSYVSVDLIYYLKMISIGKTDLSETSFSAVRHREHANAKNAMSAGNYELAYTILKELSEYSTLPYYMRYYVYDDLEICADKIGEFRTAYTAAKRKMDMLNI